ncbi:hypothetical protein MRX96_040105 [Rhipicephalus microplus]
MVEKGRKHKKYWYDGYRLSILLKDRCSSLPSPLLPALHTIPLAEGLATSAAAKAANAAFRRGAGVEYEFVTVRQARAAVFSRCHSTALLCIPRDEDARTDLLTPLTAVLCLRIYGMRQCARITCGLCEPGDENDAVRDSVPCSATATEEDALGFPSTRAQRACSVCRREQWVTCAIETPVTRPSERVSRLLARLRYFGR